MSRAKASIAFYLNYQQRHFDTDVRSGEGGYREGMDAIAGARQLEIIEDGVVAECQGDAKTYDSLFKLDATPLQQSINAARTRLHDGLRQQERNLLVGHSAQLAKLGVEWGAESPRQINARQKIDTLEQRERFVLAEVDGRPPRYGNIWLYGAILLVLSIAEVPVNRSAFELFFRETPLLATVVALLCGLMLVFLAHASGAVVRQFGYNAKRHTIWAPIFALLLIAVIALTLVVGLALLRQGYVDFILNRESNPTVASMIEDGQYRAVIFQVAANGLRADGLIFLTINVAMLTVGAIASYYQHDPHPDYEGVDRGIKATRKALSDVQSRHASKEARTMSRHQDSMRGILRNIQDSEAALSKVESEWKNRQDERQADLEAVHMVMRRRVLAYRQGFCGRAAEHGVSQIETRPVPGLALPPGQDNTHETA